MAEAEPQVPVSVVVPCYRSAGSVARALRSVFAQTAQPLEIIAVDDGSNDGTLDALRQLERETGAGRMRVIVLPENRGAASARNVGWDAARGEWVAFLDADDSWHPRKLEIQVRFMREHPEYALTGHGYLIGADYGSLAGNIPHVEFGARTLLLRNPFVTPSVMVRRSLVARFRPGQRHMEDHLLWMQLALDGLRMARIELTLASLYKPLFGAGGQSGELRAMQAAALANYRLLRREGRIGAAACAALQVWSSAKYLRRLALVAFRNAKGT